MRLLRSPVLYVQFPTVLRAALDYGNYTGHRTMRGREKIAWRWRKRREIQIVIASLLVWVLCVATVQGADRQGAAASDSRSFETADVIVDGHVIFKIRGTATFPAARRATEIRHQIIAAAEDESVPASAVILKEKDDRTLLIAGNRLLLDLFDADAQIEGTSRQILAETKQRLLQEAIANYRSDRSP